MVQSHVSIPMLSQFSTQGSCGLCTWVITGYGPEVESRVGSNCHTFHPNSFLFISFHLKWFPESLMCFGQSFLPPLIAYSFGHQTSGVCACTVHREDAGPGKFQKTLGLYPRFVFATETGSEMKNKITTNKQNKQKIQLLLGKRKNVVSRVYYIKESNVYVILENQEIVVH